MGDHLFRCYGCDFYYPEPLVSDGLCVLCREDERLRLLGEAEERREEERLERQSVQQNKEKR